MLRLDHARYHHWRSRQEQGRLTDLPPGGHPVHGLLDWERAAIVDLFQAWGEIDRSHRKLATAAHAWAWCMCRSRPCVGCWPSKA